MGVLADEERAGDTLAGAVVADGLRDREHVRLGELTAERRAAMTARAEAHPLRAIVRVGLARRTRSRRRATSTSKIRRCSLTGQGMEWSTALRHADPWEPWRRARRMAGGGLAREGMTERACTTMLAAPAIGASARAGCRREDSYPPRREGQRFPVGVEACRAARTARRRLSQREGQRVRVVAPVRLIERDAVPLDPAPRRSSSLRLSASAS